MKRLGAALAALLLAGAGPGNGKQSDPISMTAEQQKTVGLQIAPVVRRPITEPVDVPGAVTFDEEKVAVIRPLAPALVTRLHVRPGDAVRAGQTLADLEIPSLVDAQINLSAADAAGREAEAGIAVARDALRRGEILARDGSMSRAEAERRRLVLAQAQATADAARGRAAVLRAQIERLNPGKTQGTASLASPIAGVVVSVSVTPGELLPSARSAFTVADLSVVWVEAQVPERSASLIAPGDPAHVVLLSGNEHSWEGRIVALGAAIDTRARTLPARVQLPNPDGALRAGMAVQVTITSDRDRENLVVPSTAVQMVGDKHVAFTPAGGDKFQPHELQVGIVQPDWVEVRAGLTAGDEVVTQGSFQLKALLQKEMLGGSG